jgi:hypothetical protein
MQACCHSYIPKASGLSPLRPSDLVRPSLKALEVAIDQHSKGTSKRNESGVENCDKAHKLILKAKVIGTGDSIYVIQVVLTQLKCMNLFQSSAIWASYTMKKIN